MTSATYSAGPARPPAVVQPARILGWSILAVMAVFIVNNFLTFGAGLPGPVLTDFSNVTALGLLQGLLYVAAVAGAAIYVLRSSGADLRQEGLRVAAINTFFIRAAFWAVVFVGLADTVVSFLRVEGMLESVVSEQLARDLGRSQFRGPWLHLPLIGLGFVMAIFTRTLGFHWLALLIVVAELLIVIFRFIFSYEQAFMADLVRFWYGAFFLFASAFTLLEDGHVRVDLVYAGLSNRAKGAVNALGSLVLGVTLCWVILITGMGQKASIINSPVFNFETTQSGFGLYVKYLMAAFLAVFAISMMIQFISTFFSSLAAWLDGEPATAAEAAKEH